MIKSSFFQIHGIEAYEQLPDNTEKNKIEMTWSSNKENTSNQELFLKATYDIKEMIESFFIRFIRSDSNGNMKTSLNIDELKKHHVTEIRHRKFGRCYSFHPHERLKTLGIYYIRMKL